MKFDTCDISNIQISILMSIANYIRYLPPVRAKLVTKLKVLRICWNLAHSIFQICKSQSWCQKWFLLNIYHLLGTNWSQNWKCSGFIEIWHIWYFEYSDLDFDVKCFFSIKYLSIATIAHKIFETNSSFHVK